MMESVYLTAHLKTIAMAEAEARNAFSKFAPAEIVVIADFGNAKSRWKQKQQMARTFTLA